MTTVSTPNQRRNRNVIAGVGAGSLVAGVAGLFAFGTNLSQFPALLSATLAMAGIGFLFAALLMAMVRFMPGWYRESAEDQARTPAYKAYMSTMWKAMAIYVVLISAYSTINQMRFAPIVHIVSALAPMLPLTWLMFAHIRYLRGIDELQRRIEMESISIGALATSLLYMTGGFLQSARVFEFNAALAMLMVFPMLCVTYGIGKIFVIRHYS